MNWFRKNLVTIILVGLMFIGVVSYADSISEMDSDEYERIMSSARQYNEELKTKESRWNMTEEEWSRYMSELNVDGAGSMGYITIPKIDIMLPINHSTEEKVLQSAIGHIEGTSLPVGGEGTHCVLSGHRGLPTARLFTDLDKLKEGDTFTLTIMNEMLTYQIDQIRIVEPTDYSLLQFEEGADYCTLLTCTPYGINTQRLLVRGKRIANPNGEAKVVADAIQVEATYVAPFIAVPIIFVLLLWMVIAARARRIDRLRMEQARETLRRRQYRNGRP